MVQKVNGAAYPGIFVERKVAIVKMTFNKNIAALAAADLSVLGTTTAVGAGTVAASGFGVVESVVVGALKQLTTKGTILGISSYNVGSRSVDVILGHAESWFSDLNGVIATALPVTGAVAQVTTAGAAPTNVVGALVSVTGAITVDFSFAALDGTVPVATLANGGLSIGPGATPGTNVAPTGLAGYQPAM